MLSLKHKQATFVLFQRQILLFHVLVCWHLKQPTQRVLTSLPLRYDSPSRNKKDSVLNQHLHSICIAQLEGVVLRSATGLLLQIRDARCGFLSVSAVRSQAHFLSPHQWQSEPVFISD